MELYIFDNNRQMAGVIEAYEYLRWTRRYFQCGSFELKAVAADENLAQLQIGNILWKNDDEEAGLIEFVELTSGEQEFILISGRFATGTLARRIIWGSEVLHGDVSQGIAQLVTNHMLNPDDADRRIDGYAFTAPDFGIPVYTETSYRNLLDRVENLCGTADIGLKTVWNPVTRLFTITLYQGAESQAVFSREYDNVTGQMYVQSVLDYANIALVGGEGEGSSRTMVTVGGGSSMNRREIFVDAKDLRQEDFNDYEAALTQRGEAKLVEQEAVNSFDAVINQHGNLAYKTDFDLGQTVRVVSKAWGVTMAARITEIEESYDRDGFSLNITFGKPLLTLAQKLKGEMM